MLLFSRVGRLKLLSRLTVIVILGWSLLFAKLSTAKMEDSLYLSFEQRVVLSYLLAGAHLEPESQQALAARLDKAIMKYAELPVEIVKVKQFEDFLAVYRGEWPNSYSLNSDLALLEQSPLRGRVRFEAATPELARQIQDFYTNQNRLMGEKLGDPRIAEILNFSQDLEKDSKGLNLDLIKGSLWAQTDRREIIREGFRYAGEILDLQIKDIDRLGLELANSSHMNIDNPGMRIFMSTAFSEYFARLPLESKKQIISIMMGRNLLGSQMEKFEAMVLASGPQFQKLLQVMVREAGLSPELVKIFKALESKAPAVPAPIVKEILESEKHNYKWVSYDLKPLGTGTMAQVHRGVIKTDEGRVPVVIRFLKPEIAKRVSEDYRILKEIAPILDAKPEMKQSGLPAWVPLVNDLNRTVTDELVMEDTVKNQNKGREVYIRRGKIKLPDYRREVQFYVPEIFPPRGKQTNLMVQELVTGEKLDQVAKSLAREAPEIKRAVVEELSKVWIEEVFFKSGFFHSDLHQGNFLVDVKDSKVVVSILDFGMGGNLSRDMQRQFLILGSGVDLLKPEVIADAFIKLSDRSQNTITEDEFLERVKDRAFTLNLTNPENSISRWSVWAMDQGLKFSYSFVSLNRGMGILDKLLIESKSQLRVSDIARKIAPRYGISIISSLRSSKLLSWWEIIKLGWTSEHPEEKTDSTKDTESAKTKNEWPEHRFRMQVRCEMLFAN